MAVSKSTLTFTFFASLGLLIAIVGVFVLPDRFLSDAPTILLHKTGLRGSYPFSAWFYKTTGLGKLHFSFIGIIQFLIVIYLLKRIGIPKKFDLLTFKNIVIYLSIIIIGLFLGMPTKEFINFVYMVIIVSLFQNRKYSLQKTVLFGLCFILFFGYFFRPYYLLIAFLMVFFNLISYVNIKNKRFASILFGLLIVIGVSLSYGVVKGVFLSQEHRELINEERIKRENVNTIIMSPVDTDSWYGESFGIIYGFFTVNLPVNGLKHFLAPHILAFIFWELLLFYILYKQYGKCLKEGKKDNYELWLFYFAFSYFIVQGIFEPDLGSAVRHKIGFFPIIYYLLNYESFRRVSKE